MSFTIALAMGVSHLATPTEHLHAGLVSFLRSCGLAPGVGSGPDQGVRDALAIALPAVLVLALLAQFAIEVVRGHRLRSHHRYVLDVVGRRSELLGATVLANERPAVYCLPGRRPRVVVSDGALRLLSTDQLDAVLEHERAHIAGRHHLALAAAQAFAKVFWWLPLARHARDETALLLEMIADDRALRRHTNDVLATAMYEMAAGRIGAPQGAFGVGGSSAVIRLRRVLAQQPEPHPALSASMGAVSLALPLLPLLVGCTIGLGLLPL